MLSNETTRRAFLKMSALAVAASQSTQNAEATSAIGKAAPTGEIAVWVTAGSQRFARAASLKWRQSAGADANAIVLEPEKKYQEILGFGAAFTDASCYMFNQLDPAAREKLIRELFHPSELGLSVCRTCIGSSDYSTKV